MATVLRCLSLPLLVLGVFAFLPAEVVAGGTPCTPGNHGVSIFKSCVSPKNRCATDADCADADLCNGTEQCATEEAPGSNVVECTITLGNPTTHCDNITLTEAADTITNATGPGSSSSAIQITGVSTGVVSGTCTAGTDLGGATTCTISPGGAVSFLANYYTVVALDPSPLSDQATISVADTCSASPTGCSTTPNNVQFTASTTLVSGCSGGTPLTCDDNSACTTDTCDTATGCVYTPITCNDNDACTTDTCDPATGCVYTPITCDDNNVCTTDTCDPASGCVYTPNDLCNNEEICRTPGFWGTHGGTEKSSSVNITDAVLDTFGGSLVICGTTIDNTDVGNTHSALEAICVSPKGDSRLQLARQLTAAALNCGITNSTGTPGQCSAQAGATPCVGVSIEAVWDACNAACPTGTTADVGGNTVSCIGAIDCFNNGGIFDPATGDCGSAIESCHDRNLVTDCFNFQPPGAAGSPKACNDARKNNVLVVPPLP